MTEVDPDALAEAVQALRLGGVVVYPTETFYGIGADATSEAAVGRVAALKGRDGGKPILVIVASRDMISQVAVGIPSTGERLMERFWPGPLTLVVRARNGIPMHLTGGGHGIGVRLSSHAVARALSEALGGPITATSANRGGEPPATDVRRARAVFGAEADFYLDGGRSPGGLPSTVVDLTGSRPRIVREGAISASAIERAGVRLESDGIPSDKPSRASS